MLTHFGSAAILNVFLMATTALFILISLISLSHSRQTRRKLSDMVEQLAAKSKELDDLKTASQNILSPFIPETSRSIIISINPTGEIIGMNDYAAELFGYQKEELLGRSAFGTILPIPLKQDANRPNMIARIFANPKLYLEYETENIRKNGEHFWISWTNRIIYDDTGKPLELRSVGFDITKRKQLEEELRYLASVDPQTGVLNRQALLEAGMRELKRAQRYRRHLSVLVMKLDYFHDADDTHGFSDDIIRDVVNTVRLLTRDSDFIGRVGDVEFAIILPETSGENAGTVANRIKEKIEEGNLKNGGKFFVTASFGISEKSENADTIDALLLEALNNIQTKPKSKNGNTIRKSKKRSARK